MQLFIELLWVDISQIHKVNLGYLPLTMYSVLITVYAALLSTFLPEENFWFD